MTRGQTADGKKIAVGAWKGPGDALTRAIRGPFRAYVWEWTEQGEPFSRIVFQCRHKHATKEEAFLCPVAKREAAK